MAANFIYETRVSGDNHQSWLPVTEYLCHNPFLSSFTWFVTSEAQRLAVEVHELLTDFTPGVQWGFFDFLCSCCRPFTFVVLLRRVLLSKMWASIKTKTGCNLYSKTKKTTDTEPPLYNKIIFYTLGHSKLKLTEH